jgi:predicted metal-dependent hydrolase
VAGDTSKEDFKQSVRQWAGKLKVHPSQIRIQKMSRKWASCSLNNRVSFSEDILREDVKVQEYVIVHELLHLRVRNHGRLFSSLMALYLPDWEERSKLTRNVPRGDNAAI